MFLEQNFDNFTARCANLRHLGEPEKFQGSNPCSPCLCFWFVSTIPLLVVSKPSNLHHFWLSYHIKLTRCDIAEIMFYVVTGSKRPEHRSRGSRG